MWRLFEGGLCTITAQILARSLANFYRQYEDRHMNLLFIYLFLHLFIYFKIYAMRQRARADNLTVCYRKKTNGRQFFMRLPCYRQ